MWNVRTHFWRAALVLIVLVLVSLLAVVMSVQPKRQVGHSMEPTLADREWILVNKMAYRLSDAQRGDIVLMRYPLNTESMFVKRVIAREGDTVRIADGRVFVNDVPLDEPYVSPEFRGHDDWGPKVVPDGFFFLLGDHRNNSSDSRHWGYVPENYVLGKVVAR